MNSFKSIERALEYEVSRQIEMAEKGTPIIQSTLRWDDVEGRTYLMRTKENAQDYRYFPESDLSIINVSEELINNIENLITEKYNILNVTAKNDSNKFIEKYQKEFGNKLTLDQLNKVFNMALDDLLNNIYHIFL